MLNFFAIYFNYLVVATALIFATIGFIYRKDDKKDYYIISDAFNGLTIVTLPIIGAMVLEIQNPIAFKFINDQATVVSLSCFILTLVLSYYFIRSLRS